MRVNLPLLLLGAWTSLFCYELYKRLAKQKTAESERTGDEVADKSPVVVDCDQQDQVNASVEGSSEAMVATAKKSSGQVGAGCSADGCRVNLKK